MASLRRGLNRHRHSSVSSVTRAICVAEIEKLEVAGRPGAAQDFRKHVTTFLNWCVTQGHLSASPMAGYRRPRQTRAQRLAQPRLTFTETEPLRILWAALATASDPCFQACLRFGLLTGIRRGELAGLRWAHLTLTGGDPRIDLPAEITKTGEARSVPLGPLSINLLVSLPRLAGTDLVFPGRGKPDPATGRIVIPMMSGWSQRLAPVKAALGASNFGLHVLRRSYRSGLSDLGVPQEIAELMLGHKRKGLVGTYDHSGVWPARVEAQTRWEGFVAGL